MSSLWKSLGEEWRIWLTIAILLSVTLLFSNQLADWLANSTFIKVLDSLSKLGMLVAVIAFLRKIPKWEKRAEEEAKRRRFEYWKAIDASTIARENSRDGRFSSHALKIAIESLAQEKDEEGKPLKLGPVDVSGADLQGINLENAYLYVAGFRDTILSSASFYNAVLDNAYFQRAKLFGANFHGATFQGDIVFRHALYDDATKFPDGFDFIAARAYRIAPKADLQDAMLAKAPLWDAQLEEADLRRANLDEAILGGNLYSANLQNANLRRIKGGHVNLQSANLKNANLQEAGLNWANLRNANLQHADLRDAAIEDADLNGADFRKARNITVEQIKAARNWEQAIYDDDFRHELGLS